MPHLGITQTPDAAVVDSGSPIGFTVTLVNGGDGSADGLSVTDTLPSGSAVDWAVDIDGSDDGWVVTGSPPTQHLAYNSSTLHGHARIKVHVISETSDASCGSYDNHASFASHNGGWGSAWVSISVNCPPPPPPPPPGPDLSISDTADAPLVNAGSQIGFTISLANSGGGDATGIAVSDALPWGTDVTWTIDAAGSDSGWSLSGSPPSQSLVFSPTTLAAGTTSRVHVTSSTTTNSCGDLDNTAAFTSDAGPGQASDSVTVDCAPPPPPPPSSYSDTVLADSPIAYWRLGETSGTSAADSTGHGHTGSYANGVMLGVPGALSGDPNTAARFDGNRGDVSASDSPDLRLNGSWTIEFWARQLTFVGAAPGILDKGTPGNSSDYSITADGTGALTFERNNKQVSTGNGALTSSYRYFAVTYDGSRVRWYVNGILTATAAVTFRSGGSPHPFLIGKGVGQNYAHDDIDEVALYGAALSASRVAAHHAAGS